jgi:2-dehydropantoate 2-reductase
MPAAISVSASRWHVLGAGAIGCLFAHKLQVAGCPTTLLVRQPRAAKSTSVKVETGNTCTSVDMQLSAAADAEPIAFLLVTTKAQDVGSAVQSVAHRLNRGSQVLLLTNGLGFSNELRATLPQLNFFCGTTTEGAYRLGEQHIRHAGHGLTRIGHPESSAQPGWFEEWAQAAHPSIWDNQIDQSLWLKLAINCAINPLTALHGCCNGELAEAPLANHVQILCKEIMAVSAAAGFADVTEDLPEQVAEVIRTTADNRSSMLQDVIAGRDTEIQYITGHLLQVAKIHGIAADQNAALYRSIVDLGN